MRQCQRCQKITSAKITRKMCMACYTWVRRAGTVDSFPVNTHEERFFSKVQFPSLWGGCWQWIGAMNGAGYGKMGISGVTTGAHRVSYEMAVGLLSGGDLDHLCCNRSCVNPQHLEPVTHAENIRRGYERKRLLQD